MNHRKLDDIAADIRKAQAARRAAETKEREAEEAKKAATRALFKAAAPVSKLRKEMDEASEAEPEEEST